MKRPGEWLRAVAAHVCSKRTMERLIDPIVSDIQQEYAETVLGGRSWRAAWIRVSGYGGFLKAVGLHIVQSGPRVFRDSVAADGRAIGRTLIVSTIAFVAITLLMTAPPMFDFYTGVHAALLTFLLLPQAIPLSIPIALSLAIVATMSGRTYDAHWTRGVLMLAVVASVLAFGAMMLLPKANQAFRVAVIEELEGRKISEYSIPRGMNELSMSELRAGIAEYDAGGFPRHAWKFRLMYHRRFALPAATIVLSLLALAIGAAVRRRAVAIPAFLVAFFLYYLTMAYSEWKLSIALGPAAVAAWTPNILFGALSIALLTRAGRTTVKQA